MTKTFNTLLWFLMAGIIIVIALIFWEVYEQTSTRVGTDSEQNEYIAEFYEGALIKDIKNKESNYRKYNKEITLLDGGKIYIHIEKVDGEYIIDEIASVEKGE